MLIANIKAKMVAGYSPCLPPHSFAKLAAYVPTWRKIIREVAEKYDITPEDITGTCRRRMYAWPRQEAMWRCRTETSMSMPDIGRRFGNRDHTTVLYSIRAHAKRMSEKAFASRSTTKTLSVDKVAFTGAGA